MKAVILAAGVGSRLAPLTDKQPKTLVPVLGKSLLFRQLDALAAAGIAGEDVIVVGGYLIDMLRDALAKGGYRCKVVMNDKYAEWNNFYSVLVAKDDLVGHDFLQLDGDVVLDDKILPKLIAAPGGGVFAVDTCANLDAEAMKIQLQGDRVVKVHKSLEPSKCVGEYIGVMKTSAAASGAYFTALAKMVEDGITNDYYEYAIQQLITAGSKDYAICDVSDCVVMEIDDHADLHRAELALAKQV